MSYDIYGNRLERGHCEVHPDVPETSPCSRCLYETERGQEPYYEEPNWCDEEGHPFDGVDATGPRCACGERRLFPGDELTRDQIADALYQLAKNYNALYGDEGILPFAPKRTYTLKCTVNEITEEE